MSAQMDALRVAKRQLRKSIQTLLKSLSQDRVSEQSSRIHELLFAMPQYQAARNISVYLSIPAGEISTEAIVKHALKQGKRVFVPYIYKNESMSPGSVMDMVALHSENDFASLKRDKWGIPTPDKATVQSRARCLCPNFDLEQSANIEGDAASLEQLDLIVVPGVAFDKDRRRLGHGKGYYDIFFSQYHRRLKQIGSGDIKMPYLVGIALQEQILPDGSVVPTDESDWTLDSLLAGNATAS